MSYRKDSIRNYGVLVLFLTGLALLLTLGAWQLSRGLEKQDLETKLAERGNQYTSIGSKPETWQDVNHQLVKLEGGWVLDKQLLLANRVYRGQVGYEVYQPFRITDDSYIMVNRGWVSEQESKALVSESVGDGKRELRGHLYIPQAGFTLGPAMTDEEKTGIDWPKVMQYFDQAAISEALALNVSSAVLVVDEDSPASFERIYQPTVMGANRHFGYAFQWWALALTLIVFGFIWRRQAKNLQQKS